MGLNGVLAGLVSITANCQLVEPWQAIVIRFVASILLFLGHFLLKYLRIDDPCDAAVVHGICGIWRLWAAGIFCLDANVQYAAYLNTNNACKTGQQFGVQVVGSLAILAWTIGISTFMFLCIKFTVGVRISSDAEVERLYSDFTHTLLILYSYSCALVWPSCAMSIFTLPLLFLYSSFTLTLFILYSYTCALIWPSCAMSRTWGLTSRSTGMQLSRTCTVTSLPTRTMQ